MKKIILAILLVTMLLPSVHASGDWGGDWGWHGWSYSKHYDGCGHSYTFTSPICGNDKVETPETCDDGGTSDGDGCSATCQIEPDGEIPEFPTAAIPAMIAVGGYLIIRRKKQE